MSENNNIEIQDHTLQKELTPEDLVKRFLITWANEHADSINQLINKKAQFSAEDIAAKEGINPWGVSEILKSYGYCLVRRHRKGRFWKWSVPQNTVKELAHDLEHPPLNASQIPHREGLPDPGFVRGGKIVGPRRHRHMDEIERDSG